MMIKPRAAVFDQGRRERDDAITIAPVV